MSPLKVVPIFFFCFWSISSRYQQRQQGCCNICMPKLKSLLRQWVELEPKPGSRRKKFDRTARVEFIFQKIINPDGTYIGHVRCIVAVLGVSEGTLTKYAKQRREHAVSSDILTHPSAVSSRRSSLREEDVLKDSSAYFHCRTDSDSHVKNAKEQNSDVLVHNALDRPRPSKQFGNRNGEKGKELKRFRQFVESQRFYNGRNPQYRSPTYFSILFSLDINHINLQRQMILKKKRENMKKRKDTQLFMHSMNVWSIMGFVLL